jgi:hypothetical protein
LRRNFCGFAHNLESFHRVPIFDARLRDQLGSPLTCPTSRQRPDPPLSNRRAGTCRPEGWQSREVVQPPGNDLTYRFPLIVETLARLRKRSCIIDGEAMHAVILV